MWLLPQTSGRRAAAADRKRVYLESTLDREGRANYYRIVEFMAARSAGIVADDAWNTPDSHRSG